MKLKNILIVVKDLEKSKRFYKDLFGLDVLLDSDSNVMMTEGLVLQDEHVWKDYIGKAVVQKSNAFELYFEEPDIEYFQEKLKKLYPSLTYVTDLTENDLGQKLIRFYDLDGTLIEVKTPI